jgi:hypothetical protein
MPGQTTLGSPQPRGSRENEITERARYAALPWRTVEKQNIELGNRCSSARAAARPSIVKESRCSDSISNLAANRCPKIRSSEALYRAAIVQRNREKWPIGERDGRTGRPRGPELIAKTKPSLGPTKGASRTERYHLLRRWRRETNCIPTFSVCRSLTAAAREIWHPLGSDPPGVLRSVPAI